MSSKNSSQGDKTQSKNLATAFGAYHIDVDIDKVTTAIVDVLSGRSRWIPHFKSNGGSSTENLALQNIQARSCMVLAYLFAQPGPTFRTRRNGEALLVLGSANVDESLRGHYTKYDPYKFFKSQPNSGTCG